MNVFKILWRFAAQRRNPSIFGIFQELKDSETMSLEKLQNHQFEKAKEILIFSYTYSKFYNEIFAKNNFDPNINFNSIADFNRIPIISKRDLLLFNETIHTNCFFKKIFSSETSGSTGQVLKFHKDEYWDSFNRASIMRGYSWHGVNIWETNGYFWGYNIANGQRWKIRVQDAFQNRFRLFSYDKANIHVFIKKLNKATYLSGYSSMIYEVAKIINNSEMDTSSLNLKMVKGTSEKIFDSYHNQVYKAFGKKIISEYGAAESGIIAFECPEGNMHINMEGVYVEEENGEIIVTNLVARSFPIIRYKLGDYIKLKPVSFACPCGLAHPVIESIQGRVGKLVYGKERTYPSLTFYYIFKNLAIHYSLELNYQAIQFEKGKLQVNIEQLMSTKEKAALEKEMKKYFDTDIDYDIWDNKKLHTFEGKLMDFISKIDFQDE